MKRSIIICFTLTVLIFHSDSLFSEIYLSGESDSNSLAAEFSDELLKNTSGEYVPSYISNLIELAPAVGREKIAGIFRAAVSKASSGSEKEKIHAGILRLAIDELDGSINERTKNFSVIKKWNVSGPWREYGKADIECEFNPEKVLKFSDIEKNKKLLTDDSGEVFPFGFNHASDETFYATSSFASNSGVILWVVSDAEYKIIINGREITQNRKAGRKVIKAFRLNGARGYTVQIKMQSGEEKKHPYISGMITDETFKPAPLNYSSAIFSYNFTSEKLLSSDDTEMSFSHEVSVLSRKMNELFYSGNYFEAYKLGVSVSERFPSYSAIYNEFIPLLDLMNRDDEFIAAVEKFRKIFPDSDIHHRWLADFYMTRDREKFLQIVKSVSPRLISERSLRHYLFLLCGEKKFSGVLQLCHSLKTYPYFRQIIPEVINAWGNRELLRKTLIEESTERDDSDLYYSLGLAEMQIGLDPVMYWEKGLSLQGASPLMRDLSDIYENGILQINDFYTGFYTDLHPEFGWNSKKRKITIHISDSGRVFLTGEDIIPSGNKLRNEKYSAGCSEFSEGEIKTAVPYFDGVKILYVLTAKDGLPVPVDFNSAFDKELSKKSAGKSRLTVKYRSSGDEEFSVVKYSGEIYLKTDVFTLLKGLILKAEDENISALEYEVICHGNFTPLVRYKGALLSAGKYSDGAVKFSVIEKFTQGESGSADTEILKFSSDKAFAKWYSKVITYAGSSADADNPERFESADFKSFIKTVHFNIMTSISKRGDVNFKPGKIGLLLKQNQGTVEERTLLGKATLEKDGIKSFISFKKNKEGLIERILLYVPENRGRGYWLDFYGDGLLDKIESGSDAIVLTGEGYETLPVNPETYIR